MTAMTITATAPAKVILLGEHAVNRGQAALAVSVGLYATCSVTPQPPRAGYCLTSAARTQCYDRAAILEWGRTADQYREHGDYAAIQRAVAADFFTPATYLLAALGDALPPALQIRFTSDIPQSAGLGSGGAAFVALAAALARLLDVDAPRQIAAWAHRGDIIAHGGIASGLDTQTSLHGGAIRYSVEQHGQPIAYAPGLSLVIGNTGVFAATSAVNGRVRAWLAERPERLHYFHEIGLLARLAERALHAGDWLELGQLLNLNQLVLERIGVSCAELETLIGAARAAGAWGAKLSGSGGGGIMIALVPPERSAAVAAALTAAGGTAIVAPVGVPGVRVTVLPATAQR